MIEWAKTYASEEQDWEGAKKKTHLLTSETDKRLLDDIGVEYRRFNPARLPIPIGGKKK